MTIEQTAESLRQAFDEAFARPRDLAVPEREEVVLVRAGDIVVVLPVEALAGLVRNPAVTPLPSTAPALLGIGAFAGELTGMYSLAHLLSASAVPSGAATGARDGWALRVRGEPAALVFDELVGHARIDRADVRPLPDVPADAPVRRVVALEGTFRPVVDVTALVARIASWAADARGAP